MHRLRLMNANLKGQNSLLGHMLHGLRRNAAIKIKSIVTAVQGAARLLLHVLIEASNIRCRDVGRIRDDNIKLLLQRQLAKNITAHKANATGNTDFFGVFLSHNKRIHANIHAHALSLGQIIQKGHDNSAAARANIENFYITLRTQHGCNAHQAFHQKLRFRARHQRCLIHLKTVAHKVLLTQNISQRLKIAPSLHVVAIGSQLLLAQRSLKIHIQRNTLAL